MQMGVRGARGRALSSWGERLSSWGERSGVQHGAGGRRWVVERGVGGGECSEGELSESMVPHVSVPHGPDCRIRNRRVRQLDRGTWADSMAIDVRPCGRGVYYVWFRWVTGLESLAGCRVRRTRTYRGRVAVPGVRLRARGLRVCLCGVFRNFFRFS
jgi:hypothetical protein